MLILGIETSCDDTTAALVEASGDGFVVQKSMISSQAKLHEKYGGIVPEVAARKHVETIVPVLQELLTDDNKPDVIAVTSGPGLITSLQVGVETAKALAFAWDIPLVKVNHIEGHIYSPLLSGQTIKFPAIALIVSGGHTELILMKEQGQYELLGRTRDDAAGEAFDKAGAMLGLPYPGGPEISKRAQDGNPAAYDIPRPMIGNDDFEFSFSGMKNAIRLLIEKISSDPKTRMHPNDPKINDLSASIEQAIVDVLVTKSLRAVAKYSPNTFILAGGVSANPKLRETLAQKLPADVIFLKPEKDYTQDNAAMVAAAAYHHIEKKDFTEFDKLTADANWELV